MVVYWSLSVKQFPSFNTNVAQIIEYSVQHYPLYLWETVLGWQKYEHATELQEGKLQPYSYFQNCVYDCMSIS